MVAETGGTKEEDRGVGEKTEGFWGGCSWEAQERIGDYERGEKLMAPNDFHLSPGIDPEDQPGDKDDQQPGQ